MTLTNYKIKTYAQNSRLSKMQKQSQTNPNKAKFKTCLWGNWGIISILLMKLKNQCKLFEMKKLWVNAVPYNKEVVISALESGAEAVIVPDGKSETVRQFGKIKTVEKNGDILPGIDVEFIDIKGKTDEDKAAAVPENKFVVLRMLDWTIIPIENLLARRGANLMVQVENSKQAKLMVEILEKGVDGVVLNTTDINEIKKTAEIIQGITEKIPLVVATITTTKQLGMGDRSCLDTITQMSLGEGMLVGNTATGFFLVHSESIENPYVASRPFRVNAGAVHAYILTAGGKTKYLADLKTGDEVLLVDSQGKTKVAYLGRNKIEKRPMMLIEAEGPDKIGISLVVQNAETIRLVDPKGNAVSVTDLKPGDKVLAHIEKAGRHFGMKVDETLIEK
jgi:3-dehydroquinate synthase II